MASWYEGDIEVANLRLHYIRTGGEKPPVVLAHGFSDDILCWTPVAQILATEYDVVMVDARGHGRSAAPEQGYSLMDHARDIAGVIKGLELNGPAVLGHSMGGATAMVLAGAYPDVPSAILVEDAKAFGMKSSAPTQPSQEQQTDEEQKSKEHQVRMDAWITGLRVKHEKSCWPSSAPRRLTGRKVTLRHGPIRSCGSVSMS
jgi:pimeloyl-ACP methyl ester carboxylesterase